MTIVMIAILYFISAILGLIAIYMWYAVVSKSPSYEVKKRLRKLALEKDEEFPADLKLEILVEMSPLDKFFYKFKNIRKLDTLIDKAGLRIDVKIFSLIIVASTLNGLFIGAALKRGMVFPLVFMIIGGLLPIYYLYYYKAKRISKFTDQFPGTLDMISRSLKAGHSFNAAVQLVGDESSEPVGGLFRTAYEEQSLGLSMKDSFAHMITRMDSEDLRFFVTAINVYKEVGGNLSEILERLAETIRERIKLRRQVRVYTAQGRLSGAILMVIPVFMALFMYYYSPGYMEVLITEKIGRYAIVYAVISQILGVISIRKICNIKI
jgi:tight adherence protein B